SGGINEELFPGFAELAEGSTWFRHYTVAEAHTYFSVPTILSGRLITDRTKQALAVDHPNTLFTMLRDTHRMNVVEPVTNLCPEDLCAGTAPSAASPQGSPVAALLRDAAGVWTEISLPIHVTRDVTAQFAEAADPDAAVDREAGRGTSSPFDGFLASIRRERDPTLHYFHTLLPHLPWRRFPSGATYETLRGARDDQPLVREARWRWVDEPWAVQLARQRHILQARYVDALVAELTAHLKREGLWEDALVIVTSDHGIPLQPGRSRAPTQENVHEIYWVPMFLKAPGQQEGAVDDRNVTATDLLPTIADALGTRVPWQVEGTSMLDPSTDRGSEKVIRQLYGDERRPDTFRIGLEEAERRLRAEAFRADVRSADPDILPFLVGPRPDLIGRSIEDLDMGTASGRTATLDLPTRTRAGPEDPLPAFVWGTLEDSRAGEEVLVAAAVNGRIAGVSTTWVQDGVPGRFGVIAPETFVRRGENALALFVLEGDELRPIEVRR
ncbi:MAG TPA: sulfatase-like hydrolase/transferase, partial [Actinomycetota bacterium]|nr:sulfatase-like hydrolase/transferase [Actinomycetota bacterium]